MSSILIIEDEKRVSEVLKAYLEKEGYKVYCTTKGLEGIEIFKSIDIQLIILDLMLPDISGEEVCKIIRQSSDVHIFMLTAKGALNDRIEGLNIGADEYLIKPFSPRELTARVNALFRRLSADNSTSNLIFDDGKLSIDYDKRVVKVNGKEVSITPNEFDILYALVSNKGKVLSREQLIDKIFGIDFNGYDRTIDVHIKNIRKKIEEDTKNPKYIVTVMKVGYKFGGEN
ncbi:DNA-binding response regulator [Clostridium sporogenes]|jgi:DNA-binding response OmpR family regulator|uniref:Stage 0 sporulation protein A homolog n=2 Tax=Clostridium TaxID=1485 RepID=A0AAE5C6V9_CLOSG|nr:MULTISPECIES: response regulator transcription factor [Clostridium]MBE6076827.1 response regulator transcription factor [Clostridium lundense]MDU2833458.1 response regulator transcription factor [Clostridium botulinum]EDU38894.1 response regulator receiver domain protein [Clostridium sporogenes ATCC 15579]KIS23024.1 transcriptional regulator [Clostridium botulinum B2 450]MCW6095186.1 response regulator transcription factor [Clostridium sporogenes]